MHERKKKPMLSKKQVHYLKRGIFEELCSPTSFNTQDKYRYLTCILWAFYLKTENNTDSNTWIQLALSDVADQWERYFDGQKDSTHNRRQKQKKPG